MKSRQILTKHHALHDLFEDPARFLTDIYKPRVRKDSYTMVYEGKQPAYHEDIDCENLNSDELEKLMNASIRLQSESFDFPDQFDVVLM